MKTIIRPRGKGKTAELINISHDTSAYIICKDLKTVAIIMEMALSMNKKIPLPITFEYFNNKRYYGHHITGFLFDGIDDYIQYMSNRVPVLAITARESDELPPLPTKTNWKNYI